MEERLEGTWQMIRAELAGEAAPELVTTHTIMKLRGDAYQVLFDGQEADRGTYAITTGRVLRSLQLQGTAGPNAGRTIPCIFQLAGNRLRICYGLDGVLPDAFQTRPGDERYLAVYRRTGD